MAAGRRCPASAEDMVVVAARGIGLHPGERVDSAKPLVLGEGQHVTLIAVNGVTLKLDGPYDKPPAAAERRQRSDHGARLRWRRSRRRAPPRSA